MTDPGMADATYIEPITWQVLEKIIAKEKPDALLPTMGGQTALNCALDLHKHGVLAKYGVEMIGANEHAIEKAEDRLKFKDAMTHIGLGSARSGIAHSMDDALAVQRRITAEIGGTGFPMVIRPSFTLGGTGGGIAYNPDEFEEICKRGLDLSPTKELLIEESLIGWKEFEMEVVRDRADNCIIVCAIENLDPMGIHTGDSITVAPAQTLSRQGIPADAQRVDRHPARDRRGHRRLERAVRHQPGGRAHGGHRDEPARQPLFGAGVEGHRLPDRQGRRQAGGGLHAGRTAQRHHRRRHAGQLRAQHRLRGDEDPALCLREVPRGRPAPGHADEVGGRGHGHRPHVPGKLPEGAARPGDRHRRPERTQHRPRRDHRGDRRGRPRAHPVRGRCLPHRHEPGRDLRGDRHRPVVPGADPGDRVHREGAGRPHARIAVGGRDCAS